MTPVTDPDLTTVPTLALPGAGATSRPDGSFLPDHLGWWRAESYGRWCRLSSGDGPGPHSGPLLLTDADSPAESPASTPIDLSPEAAEAVPPPLFRQWQALAPLIRIASPSVWEASATAVLRQVVHRNQARVLFDRFCMRFGAPAFVAGTTRYAFPTAGAIAGAAEDDIRELGIGFKSKTLKALAGWYVEMRDSSDEVLLDELPSVRGIGGWTHAVTRYDRRNDFSSYPIDDLAVQTHARLGWPDHPWPESPAAFAREWAQKTAPHTAECTAYLLAGAVLSERSTTLS